MTVAAGGFNLTLDLRGVEELLKKNSSFPARLAGAVRGSLQGVIGRTVVDQTIRDLQTRSQISRKIWGRNPSGLIRQGLVHAIRARTVGDSIETGLALRGIPALLERGGRFKPHKIKGKRAHGYLVFFGRPRDEWSETTLVFTKKRVKHPGNVVMPHGFGGSA